MLRPFSSQTPPDSFDPSVTSFANTSSISGRRSLGKVRVCRTTNWILIWSTLRRDELLTI